MRLVAAIIAFVLLLYNNFWVSFNIYRRFYSLPIMAKITRADMFACVFRLVRMNECVPASLDMRTSYAYVRFCIRAYDIRSEDDLYTTSYRNMFQQ